MDSGITGKGAGISALLLSLGILFTLTEKEILSSAEAVAAVDIALDNLKRVVMGEGASKPHAVHSAENIPESVRAQF